MRKRIALLMTLAAWGVLVILPATASATITLTAKEQKVVTLINQIRCDHGLAKLTVKPCLVRAARSHSAAMRTHQFFGHRSVDGESVTARLIRFGFEREGFRFWKVGENIAYGSGLYATPEVVVDGWMNSEAHRAVILTKSFRRIGIGVKRCDQGFNGCPGPVFFYTLDLGRRIR